MLDLFPFIEAAKQQLVDSGFALAARIPEVHPTVELFPASTLVRAQTAYGALDAAANWLPWITLLLLVGGVLLARHRRRATMAVGLGVIGTMVALAVALLIARGLLVGAVAEQAAAPAAATFDIVVRFLRIALRTLVVVGLLVALGAWATGPSPAAVGLRRTLSGAVARLRRGAVAERLQDGPVGPWVHDHRGPLRVALVLLAADPGRAGGDPGRGRDRRRGRGRLPGAGGRRDPGARRRAGRRAGGYPQPLRARPRARP